MLGPAGFGDAHYVQGDSSLAYDVRFENESTATAPARLITVTNTLDPNLVLSTFELTEIEFANHPILIPQGLDSYSATVPMTTPTGASIVVNVQASLDRSTRTLSLVLQALDPATGWYSDDPSVGLLYPEDGTYRGVGSINYMVKPLPNLPSGTVIENQAAIVFDYNDPINTPLVKNTLDAAAPTSQVDPLPATTTNTSFPVSWSGQDEANGSGIASYDLYVSVDGGTFSPFLTGTTATSTAFTGLPGHTYAFYTLARDNVGHVEEPPSQPEATIQIPAASTKTTIQPSRSAPQYGDPLIFTATVTAIPPGSATPTGTVQFIIDGNNYGNPVTMIDGVASIADSALAAGSHTAAVAYTSDNSGFIGSTGTLTGGLTIGKAILTIKADDKSRAAGEPNPPLTVSYSGFVNGDGPSSLTSPAVLTTTADTGSPAGTYPITVGGATSPDYRITFVAGTLTVVPTGPPPVPPPVSVADVRDVANKKHQVTEVIVTFSGAVNAAEADNPAIYRLTLPGKKGSYTAKNAKVIKLKSAVYDPADNAVTLIPTKPFALKKPVQLVIDGLPPSGLQDGSGRFLDGARTGRPGSNAVAILAPGGATVEAIASGTTGDRDAGIMAIVDALFEQDALTGLTTAHRHRHS
jgi:hypothetical protein